MVTYHTAFLEESNGETKYYMYEVGNKYYVTKIKDLEPIDGKPAAKFVTSIGIEVMAIIKTKKQSPITPKNEQSQVYNSHISRHDELSFDFDKFDELCAQNLATFNFSELS